MIEQVKILLREREVTRAVIIDDAYDGQPHRDDIEDAYWDRFFDDLGDDEEKIASAYGEALYAERDATELRRDDAFIAVVWNAKADVGAAGALFEEFQRRQERKRAELEPLRVLLQRDLELNCQTFGRENDASIAEADIIFLDLFLGFMESEDAVNRAIERVKAVVAQRKQSPPTVVLLSASPMLPRLGPKLRDAAELLGCQFRMVRKADLGDAGRMIEQLYDLALSYPDALKLNAFLLAWDAALEKAKKTFLRSIRTLDLADYANMQALILEAEDEPVGDFVLDLYDLHLHSVLEGDEGLVRAAKKLNEIKWDEYPPAQFMPSAEAIEIMDGALFHNEVRTTIEAEIDNNPKAARLGDVFLGPPAAVGEAAFRQVFVVMSQACDLQHGQTDRLLLLRGTVHPYSWKQHESRTQGPRTPVMRVGENQYALEWDVLAPEVWRVDDVPARVAEGYRRCRRFRMPFALQLQQAFIGRLARVGTLAALPTRHAAAVKIFLRTRAGVALLLAETRLDADDAVCLVGRTAKNALMEWLLLSERLQNEVRQSLRDVPAADLPVGGAAQVAAVRDDPAFYRRLKRGLLIRRDATDGTKPFNGTGHDILQIITGHSIEPGAPVKANMRPLIVEVEIA